MLLKPAIPYLWFTWNVFKVNTRFILSQGLTGNESFPGRCIGMISQPQNHLYWQVVRNISPYWPEAKERWVIHLARKTKRCQFSSVASGECLTVLCWDQAVQLYAKLIRKKFTHIVWSGFALGRQDADFFNMLHSKGNFWQEVICFYIGKYIL